MQSKPTDLAAVDVRLLELQNEVRAHFDWGLTEDVESAHALLSEVESCDVESWARARRVQTVASLHRRLVLRETDVAILGAAITIEEVEDVLAGNTLLIAADGSCGVLDTLPESRPSEFVFALLNRYTCLTMPEFAQTSARA